MADGPDYQQNGDYRRALTFTTWQVGPYLGLSVVAWVLVLFGGKIDWADYWISVAALVVGAGGGIVVSATGHRQWGNLFGTTLCLAALALLRQASGGVTAGISAVAYLAVLQTAINSRSRNELIAVLVLYAAYFVVPIVILGPPNYPSYQYRSALLSVAVAAGIGFFIQQLVTQLRERTERLRFENRLFLSVRETVQRLFESDNPRDDICGALQTVTGATLVQIYEFDHDLQALRCIACNPEIEPVALGWVAREGGTVTEAFERGQRVVYSGDAADHVTGNHIWRACGEPASLLYEPMLDFGRAAGLLVVGWRESVEPDDVCVSAAALLAHEAAAVIRRADHVDLLEDEAETDALTGLANRRVWDAALAEAGRGSRQFAIAIFDVDHFKEYNDNHGHLAGDVLLKDCAVAWRERLRPGDVLARIGGEEFALLIRNSARTKDSDDDGEVAIVVERLRAATPAEVTCSAGVAVRELDESAERVLARADAALYAAKSAGRDRLVHDVPDNTSLDISGA